VTAQKALRTVEMQAFHVPHGAPTPAAGRVILIRMPGVMMSTTRPTLIAEVQCDCGLEPVTHLARMVRVESEKQFCQTVVFLLVGLEVYMTVTENLKQWVMGDESS